MKKITFLLSILIGLILGCTPDSLQSDISPRNEVAKLKAKNYVPFKGTVDALATFGQGSEGRCAGLNSKYLTLGYEGSGNVTHMGNVKLVGTQCVDPSGEVLDPAVFVDDRFTLIAANGDKIYFLGETGRAIPTADPLIWNVEENYIIIGGTGRFKNAEGYGKAPGKIQFLHFPPDPNDPPLPGTTTFDGVIAF